MKKKDWHKQLKQEFGIHFKNSKGEFQFLCEFIDELLQEQREDIIKTLKERADKLYCTADHLGYHDKNCEGLPCEKSVLEVIITKIKESK